MNTLARRCSLAIAGLSLATLANAAVSFGDTDPTFNAPNIPFAPCREAIGSPGDGSLYIGASDPQTGYDVIRLRQDGSLDTAWGVEGRVSMPTLLGGEFADLSPRGFLALPDGGVIVIAQKLVRLTRTGAVDRSYGFGGMSDALTNDGSNFIESFARQPDGSVVVLVRGYNGGPGAAFTRVDANGKRDAQFGVNGILPVPFDTAGVRIYGWSVQDNGSVEYGEYEDFPASTRLEPRLKRVPEFVSYLDPAFLPKGRLAPKAGRAAWLSANVQVEPDGGMLFAAGVCGDDQCNGLAVAISRFLSNGSPDPGFGDQGRVIFSPYAADTPYRTTVYPKMLSVGPGGSMTAVVHGEQTSGGFFPTYFESGDRVFRLTRQGTLDASFQNNRKLPSYQFTRYLQQGDGKLVSVGQQSGCATRLTSDQPRLNARIAEFYQPILGHYFITAEGLESGILDSDTTINRWDRTGLSFGGWLPLDYSGATRVCRFYGDLQAGPNSHFYTLEGSECEGLKAMAAGAPLGTAAWRFEGYAFSAAAPANGACATNLSPVYRAYNRGFEQGGVPNHRYTTDIRTYESMLAMGWAPEGVKFCVPPVSSNITGY